MAKKKKVFLICPVRKASKEIKKKLRQYVKKLEKQGYQVHWPTRDTDQKDPHGYAICWVNSRAGVTADEIHDWFDPTSEGSVFDVGEYLGAYACGRAKEFKIVNLDEFQRTRRRGFWFHDLLWALHNNDQKIIKPYLDEARIIVRARKFEFYFNLKDIRSIFRFGIFFGTMACGRRKKFILVNPEDVKPNKKEKDFPNVILAIDLIRGS